MHHRHLVLAAAGLFAATLVLGGCGAPDSAGGTADTVDDAARGDALRGDGQDGRVPGDEAAEDEAPQDDRASSGDDPHARGPEHRADAAAGGLQLTVEGSRISMRGPDGATTVVDTASDEPHELLHAVARPGQHDAAVVLTLFRVADPGLEVRYELRYFVVDEDGASESYWFPWRLQIDARAAEVLDVPPLPVWAPDGSALAWIEWNGTMTTLRIVGWHDGSGSNPSDATATFRLSDVEPGTQLRRWDSDEGGLLSAVTPEGEKLELDLGSIELARSRADA